MTDHVSKSTNKISLNTTWKGIYTERVHNNSWLSYIYESHANGGGVLNYKTISGSLTLLLTESSLTFVVLLYRIYLVMEWEPQTLTIVEFTGFFSCFTPLHPQVSKQCWWTWFLRKRRWSLTLLTWCQTRFVTASQSWATLPHFLSLGQQDRTQWNSGWVCTHGLKA